MAGKVIDMADSRSFQRPRKQILAQSGSSASVDNLEHIRLAKLVQPFIGTYVASTTQGVELATVTAEEGLLKLSHARNSMVYADGEKPIRLDFIGKGIQYSTDSSSNFGGTRTFGVTHIQTEVFISETSIAEMIIETRGGMRSVSVRSYNVLQGLLKYTHHRSYEVLKYKVFGPWVKDTKSFNARHYAYSSRTILFEKTSDQPITYEKLLESARQQPEVYYALGKRVSADELKKSLQDGQTEVLTPVVMTKAQRKKMGMISGKKILEFPSASISQCRSFFAK